MTDRSPPAETIRFIIEILSARTTPLAELPQTISNISRAVARLGVAAEPARLPAPMKIEPRPVLRAKPPRRVAIKITPVPVKPILAKPPAVKPDIVEPAPAVSAAEVPEAATPTVVTPPVESVVRPAARRGRPRRVAVAPEIVEAPPPPDAPPPQPRLLRRADAQASEAQHHPEPGPTFRAPEGALRGVVKWFDGRAGKGALRLTGISGDVFLDPEVLNRSGIKRLYKDQEIEATVEESGGRVRLLSMSLPTRSSDSSPNIMAGEITGTVRRQPRAVQVQIKRDGIRQSAARAEAEQVLGGVGRIKVGRRLTP